jgi:pimeloyl-ACP methyl ester carboxylesterase
MRIYRRQTLEAFMRRHLALRLSILFAMSTVIIVVAQQVTPSSIRQMRANGVDLQYVEQGNGPAVVFIHGAVGDLRFWEPQRAAFAKQHRFVAYTYRYHGTAPWPDDGKQYSAETHAADLSAFISGLKAGPVHLVGLSYGGMLAAMVALKEPQLVRTLTLAEPGLISLLSEMPDGAPVFEQWIKGVEPMAAALKSGDTTGALRHINALVTGSRPEDFDKLPASLRQILHDNARTMAPLFAAPPVAISCDQLRGIKTPTLIVRGERTPVFFNKINEAVSACITGSKAAVIPKASHTMSFDNPGDFNRTVLSFLAKPPEPAAAFGRP